jgi:enoyl-CoA hydratase
LTPPIARPYDPARHFSSRSPQVPVPYITLEVSAHVATLTLSPLGGAYDRGLLDSLAAAAGELAGRTGDVRAVVLAAGGADFGAGWSEAVLSEGAPATAGALLGAAFETVAAIPQPVVAAIRGRAHSAGLELALACDIRVAGAGASFAMPETGLGRMPQGGGTQRLPRAIGRAHALRLLLLGETIDAAEALRIGLVSRVVSDGEELAAAHELAVVIAARGPIATRFAKEAIYRGSELSLAQALRHELDLTVILQTTRDRAEGVRAFIERRPPEFEGR